MDRRDFLKFVAMLSASAVARSAAESSGAAFRRVRPGDPEWPSAAEWEGLRGKLQGDLLKLSSPFTACGDASSPSCKEILENLKNPYFLGDTAALTQTSGWLDHWKSMPSAYAVAAKSAQDVAAAVDFARQRRLRLVVKGGGHSYQGTSNAPDSLLIWTRPMDHIQLHDSFVPRGCEGRLAAVPAVSVGSGCIWMRTYNAVTTAGGRYVQGGGCATVGVAGLIQSGGFGSLSKRFGTAAAGLLEAEVVTADGAVRIANAATEPELFWGLKGGGGGSLGVVTRLTLRTHELPEFFGGAFGRVRAHSEAAFRRLVLETVRFYGRSLFNPHWGEQMAFHGDNSLNIAMVFQGLDQHQAEQAWKPFLDWVASSPRDYSWEPALGITALPARHFWDPVFLKKNYPQFVLSDERPGAPATNVFWSGNLGEAGQLLYAYRSVWLPQGLLAAGQQQRLADTLFAASRHWSVSLHFNKGLAGAPPEALARSRDTATNPAVLDAFALVIIACSGPPAFPGMPEAHLDVSGGRRNAQAVDDAMNEVLQLVPRPGSYVSESDFREPDWQRSFWGSNYPRLAAAKRKYDPEGLFFVHHGVGSESWSADGFTRSAKG
ncbi:MAG TPA: FAD-binding oxidoreductase [Terriglobales bacterium]|nr:FAD-binding oxidoreductase [Terriglobales bacterium]